MQFLKFGLILLLVIRVTTALRRWGDGRGEPITHEGETLHARVSRNKSKEINAFEIAVDVPNRFRFSLRPETSLDQIAKVLGVAREWQTGDQAFDSAVFIVSEDWPLLETMSADAELRIALMTLLQIQRGGRVECVKGRLSFVGVPTDVYRGVSDELAQAQLAGLLHSRLSAVRDRLARIPVGGWEADRDPAIQRRALFAGASVLLGMAGIAGFFVEQAFARHQIVHEMIPYWSWCVSATLCAALLVAMMLCVRRSPHTHVVLLDILLVALPGAWFACSAGLTWYNQQKDLAPAMRSALKVERVFTTRNKNKTSYHVVVEKWPDGRGEREVILLEREYALANPGTCVFAILHPGRLGDTWVSGFEHAFAEDCDLERVE